MKDKDKTTPTSSPSKKKNSAAAEATPNDNDNVNNSDQEDIPPPWTLYTALSYATVILLIGLPLWWRTTAVQRVPLPYADMAGLSDQVRDSFLIRIPVRLVGFSKGSPNEENRVHDLPGYTFSITDSIAASAEEMDALYKTKDIEEIDREICGMEKKKRGEVEVEERPISIYYVGRSDLLKQYGSRMILGNCKSFYYISNSSKLKFQLVWDVLRRLGGFGEEEHEESEPADRSEMPLPLSDGYNVLFSLLVPEPEVLDAKWWGIEEAVEAYISPMLRKLGSFAEFSVRSQVLYYIRLNVYPKWNQEQGYNEIPYSQLPLVINPVESKLTSFVSQRPVLNFLTYTAPCGKVPLQILDSDGSALTSNAFLVPQWGGIFIYNPPCSQLNASTKTLTIQHNVTTNSVISVMISQFRSLIGLPNEEEYFEPTSTTLLLPFHGSALRDWEVDMILRRRMKRLVLTASNTLHSLGQLLDEITNIVVTEEVGDQVQKGVESVKAAIEEAAKGNLDLAQKHAIEAYKASEIAFHHPKNLKQLYFPDDQKYAIYIPLFLPVGIPVLMNLRGLVRWGRR